MYPFKINIKQAISEERSIRGCGGSLVVHQTVKPAVPGSNPASLQPAGTCHSLLGSQQGWHETAGWPLRGGRGKKIQKYEEKKYKFVLNLLYMYSVKQNLNIPSIGS